MIPISSKSMSGDRLAYTILKGANKSIEKGKQIGNAATWVMEL